MEIMLAVLAACFYCLALTQVLPGLTNSDGIQSRRVLSFAALALLAHIILLKDLILEGPGQNLSILNVASLISFIISAITTITATKIRVWFLLPVVYSFAAINLCAATLLPGAFVTHLEAHPQVLLHISLALFAYSTLMIACLYAIQLAYLDNKLRSKKKLAINPNLPPLMMVERQLFKVILIGHTLLTTTLLTGFWFVGDMFAQGKAHKAIFSLLAWVVYTVLLWGHYQKGWRGRPVIWFSIIGAFLLTLAYFGSRFVKEVIIGG
ncbi:cytochrome C assembly family protein [Thaumasiovibrio subtropicus]|uniref:cytochrome C assembly family protein n=1 Tax=Thaumasiovibrio subtropicus TaxID=1891207 RepID=UPI000B34EC15|nr:inner membrane protein YpjD [Thaumasiovibrio subtropicus]